MTEQKLCNKQLFLCINNNNELNTAVTILIRSPALPLPPISRSLAIPNRYWQIRTIFIHYHVHRTTQSYIRMLPNENHIFKYRPLKLMLFIVISSPVVHIAHTHIQLISLLC